MTHRYREQARSHNGPGKAAIFSATKIPAREGAGTVNIIIA
jgi:hypothetical protein